MLAVLSMDDGEGVELDPVPLQPLEGPQDAAKGPLSLAVDPIAVMQMTRAIQAQANEELLSVQKLTPGVIEQEAVGLEGVADARARWAVLLLERDDPLEEFHSHQGRLAPLPGEADLRGRRGDNVLLDEALQHVLGHTEALPRAV